MAAFTDIIPFDAEEGVYHSATTRTSNSMRIQGSGAAPTPFATRPAVRAVTATPTRVAMKATEERRFQNMAPSKADRKRKQDGGRLRQVGKRKKTRASVDVKKDRAGFKDVNVGRTGGLASRKSVFSRRKRRDE